MFHSALSGVSHEVELTTVVGGRPVDVRSGSLLWTHFGISGPVVMDASRFWTSTCERGGTAEMYANLLPHQSVEQVRQWFFTQAAAKPRRSLAKTLALLVPERVAAVVSTFLGCDPERAAAQVTRPERERVLGALVRLLLPVHSDRGWNYAEVTAGGVPLEEIHYRTMESRLVPGLYLIGEILDCDGRIGGFNFQWAWATGYAAGCAAMA